MNIVESKHNKLNVLEIKMMKKIYLELQVIVRFFARNDTRYL